MGRSGKTKKSQLSQAVTRSEIRPTVNLPAPNSNSIIIGFHHEFLAYYSPEEKKLYGIDVGLELDSDSEYADQEHYDEVEFELAEAIALAIKEGRPVEDISVTKEFEIDVSDGASYDRSEERFREETITIDGSAGIQPDLEIWHEDDYEDLLSNFTTKKSSEILAILKEEEKKEKLNKAEISHVKNPAKGSILEKAVARGRKSSQ